VPAGLTGGVGAAAACAALAGLNDDRMRNALGIAMCTAFGLYVSVGSDTLSYITGATARSGYTAFELAARGMTAPATAFEGEKGMFVTHTDEKPEKIAGVLDSLGRDPTGASWRIFGQSYKTVPTETITHAPIELALEILKRARGRAVAKMTFGVEQIVVKIVKERNERFGLPKSDLEARFDLRYCAAAAWVRGRFTLAEMQRPAYTDPAILAMRDKIELVADPARKTFEGAWLEVKFADGSVERANVDNFLGTPGNRMSDAQLSEVFRVTAAGHMPKDRIEALLAAVWGLDRATDVRGLMALARTGG
jgi:2-methylcitrate dehydratase PrpD